MSQEASRYREDEKTRPCTTCRMPVSILATKCRYCGAELGRPREETRSLSAQDLGGENIKHYAPSSNVMDALESFRTEQASQVRRGNAPTGIPELDARSRALASAARPSQIGSGLKRRRFAWGDYVRYALGGGTALALVAAAMTIIPRLTSGTPDEVVYINQTATLMEQGAEPLAILAAACDGVRNAPGADSEALRAQARELVRAQVEARIDAPDWSREDLQEASSIALKAENLDPYEESRALKKMVDEEVLAYNIALISVSAAENAFTFREPRGPETVVTSRDELIMGRFQIARVTDSSVRLRDQRRGNRELIWPVGGSPNSR